MDEEFKREGPMVEIEAPARLHLGFYNIKLRSRLFGGLGLAVTAPSYRMRIYRSSRLSCEGAQVERVSRVLSEAASRLDVPGARVVVDEAIPEHVGLGSTTQLTLSIYYGLTLLYNLKVRVDEIAEISGRGRISRVGVEAFKRGGFIVDSGRTAKGRPKTMARLNFPLRWSIVTVTPSGKRGFREEEESMEVLMPYHPPRSIQRRMLELTFLGIVPGIIERDFNLFTSSLERLQVTVGSFYSTVQGGVFCCEESMIATELIKELGGRGVGQSSWGPTVYGFFRTRASAERAAGEIVDRLSEVGIKATVRVIRGRNRGAKVNVLG